MIKNNIRLRLEKRAAVACEQLLSRRPMDLYAYRTLQELNANEAQSRPDYELRHLIDEINDLHGLDLFVQSSVTTTTINPTTFTESATVPLQQSQLKPARTLTLEREYLLHLTNVESAFSRRRALAAYSDYILKPVARFLKFVKGETETEYMNTELAERLVAEFSYELQQLAGTMDTDAPSPRLLPLLVDYIDQRYWKRTNEEKEAKCYTILRYARLLGERNSESHSGLAGLQDDDIIKKIHEDKKPAIQDQGLSESEKVVVLIGIDRYRTRHFVRQEDGTWKRKTHADSGDEDGPMAWNERSTPSNDSRMARVLKK